MQILSSIGPDPPMDETGIFHRPHRVGIASTSGGDLGAPLGGGARQQSDVKTDPTAPAEDNRRFGHDLKATQVSTLFMWLGLFTLSWDRFASFHVSTFNVKLPTVAFFIALALTVLDNPRTPRKNTNQQNVLRAAITVVLVFGGMAIFAEDRSAAMYQTLTVLLGALTPFLAVYWNIRKFGRVDQAFTALIRGGIFAAAFGLYQLAAYYLGLPQVVTYTALSGGFARISSFSYEAGFFGYFLVLVIATLVARSTLRNEAVNRRHFTFFVLTLVLTNSRATVFTIPLLFMLLFVRWPKSNSKAKILPWFIAGAYCVMIALLAFPKSFIKVWERASTVFDPKEASSNAPRLEQLDFAWQVAQHHLTTGIGGGNLIRYAPTYGLATPTDAGSNQIIVNNVWLQALLDGGVVLLAAEALLVLIAVTMIRSSQPAVRMLMAGWISVMSVSSLITSYYFDMKLWVVIALAAALATFEAEAKLSGSVSSAIPASPRRVQQSSGGPSLTHPRDNALASIYHTWTAERRCGP